MTHIYNINASGSIDALRHEQTWSQTEFTSHLGAGSWEGFEEVVISLCGGRIVCLLLEDSQESIHFLGTEPYLLRAFKVVGTPATSWVKCVKWDSFWKSFIKVKNIRNWRVMSLVKIPKWYCQVGITRQTRHLGDGWWLKGGKQIRQQRSWRLVWGPI